LSLHSVERGKKLGPYGAEVRLLRQKKETRGMGKEEKRDENCFFWVGKKRKWGGRLSACSHGDLKKNGGGGKEKQATSSFETEGGERGRTHARPPIRRPAWHRKDANLARKERKGKG